MSLETIAVILALMLILLCLSVAIIVVSTIVRGLLVVFVGLRWVWRGLRWLRHPRMVRREPYISLYPESFKVLAPPNHGRVIRPARRRRAVGRRPGGPVV